MDLINHYKQYIEKSYNLIPINEKSKVDKRFTQNISRNVNNTMKERLKSKIEFKILKRILKLN